MPKRIKIEGPFDCPYEALGIDRPPDEELEAARASLAEYLAKGGKTLDEVKGELARDELAAQAQKLHMGY